MPIPSIYINLEDDVAKVVQRIKKEKSDSAVLVCPKRCLLLADAINLKLLKKQVELLGKEVFILTMDERGQQYATEAGFQLKFLPKTANRPGISDIRRAKPVAAIEPSPMLPEPEDIETKPARVAATSSVASAVSGAVSNIGNLIGEHVPSPLRPRQPLTKVEVIEGEYIPPENESAKQRKQARSHRRFTMTLVAASLILIVVLTFVVLPKATVAIYPKTEPITRDWDMNMKTSAEKADSDKLILPAVRVEETAAVEDKFQSQGKKEVGNTATGMVRIYNFTRSPLNLKAATTVLTIGSKNYVLTEDLAGIRITGYKNTATKEVDESTLSAPVAVAAAAGGESFNVPAGTRMEITNQVLGSNPQFLFAKTETAISGGTSRYLSVVTEQDITAAQTSLAERALKQIQDTIASQGLVFAEKSYTVENLGFTTDKAVNTESPSFEGSLQLKVTGLAFRQDDLKNLIASRVNQTLPSGKTLDIGESDQLAYKLKSIDLAAGTATVAVHYEGKAIYNFDPGDLSAQLVGKSRDQVSEILRSKQEIDKIEITLAPSWQKTFPLFSEKIQVMVKK